jgi:hypothetical protein
LVTLPAGVYLCRKSDQLVAHLNFAQPFLANLGFRAYQIEGVFRHNFYRSLHEETGPLVLCRKLCDEAQVAANELAAKNLTGHVTERHGDGLKDIKAIKYIILE